MRDVSLPPCFLCFPPLKCFSPTAGHTVVETLCQRKDSGTDFTSCWTCGAFCTLVHQIVFCLSFFLRLHSLLEACAHAFKNAFSFGAWHMCCCVVLPWRGMSLCRRAEQSPYYAIAALIWGGANFLWLLFLLFFHQFLLLTAENQSVYTVVIPRFSV